jgi:hypothetical protein
MDYIVKTGGLSDRERCGRNNYSLEALHKTAWFLTRTFYFITNAPAREAISF